MDYVEMEGDTVDQAIENALKALGVRRDRVSVDVLDEGAKGFLGIGAKKARIRASVRKAIADEAGGVGGADAAAIRSDQEATAKRGREALAEILRLMGIEAAVEIKRDEAAEEIILEIQGDHGGLLIGRKGQTLEALQHVVNRTRGREGAGATQLVVDTGGYRERHMNNLKDTALRLGERAKRQRKPIKIANLSAGESRIVHLALQDDPWLTTKSQGQGPYRQLLIVPQGARKSREEEAPAAARQVPKPGVTRQK
ncbi:MAG: RNA-binding cell elongation regulator Jag/EloR [Candidatus Binatia bacterium]